MAPAKPPPPPLAFKLRAGRALHPGGPDQPATKRTSAEKKTDDEAAAAKKQAESKKKQNGIEKAAEIEERQAQEDDIETHEGNKPPTATRKKVLRPRPEKETEPSETANDADFVDPISDGPGSSDEFVPDSKTPEDEDDGQLDPSEDEDTAVNAKRATAKAKPGRKKGAARQAVEAARSKISQFKGTGKRKSPPRRVPYSV
ncbi:hypothetical protein C8R43DRAFT_1124739 [Mycena crocata]|nr:hypothetical protein C8R43DRAFT_1124739 [Mycena crocata]